MILLKNESILKEQNKQELIIKSLAALILTLITTNLILIQQNPIRAYQYSFLNFLPIYFWFISISIFIIASSILIIFQNIKPKYRNLFFIIILLNNGIILFSPYLGGAYLMNPGDLPTYGGMVLDIFTSNSINFGLNFYPFTHLLCVSLSAITGFEPLTSVIILAPLFSLLFPILIYIITKEITKEITKNDNIAILAFLLSSSFLFSGLFPINSTTTPFGLSILMMPLLFFFYIKTREFDTNISIKICLFLILLAYIIFHPIIGSLIFLMFAIILFLDLWLKIVKQNFIIIFFYFTIFLFYIIYTTTVWKRPLNHIYDVIEFGLDYSKKSGFRVDIQENLSKLDFDLVELIKLFIKLFGHQFILMILSLLFVFFIFYKKDLFKKVFHFYWIVPLITWTLLCMIILGIQIINPVLIISFYRFLYASLIFMPIFVSLLVIFTCSKKWRCYISIFLVSLIFINTCLVIYPSPYISHLNPQVTYSDQSGSKWIIQSCPENTNFKGYLGASITKRIISSLITYSEYVNSKKDFQSIEDHLGYLEHSIIGESISNGNILIITKHDVVAYTQVYKKINRINFNDLKRLNYDSTASLIYTNDDYLAYEIS